MPGNTLVIALKSSSVSGWMNILLLAVPIGLIFHWLQPECHARIFAVNFLAIIPMANLLSFLAQGLTRKIPRSLGMVPETMLGAAVEIILCMLLLFKEQYQVIQAALLGSMLTNLLLCTGLCFIGGGIRYQDQELDKTVVETSSGLLLLSIVSLAIPVAFHHSTSAGLMEEELQHGLNIRNIARYIPCLEIQWIVSEGNFSDAFVGLILVPLIEKTAEHLTAVDEAWDNAMDSALSHLLGCTIQTALMVAPIIVIAGWIAGKDFSFNFDIYMIVVLVLSVLVVGNFLKDRKSNHLDGALCVILYLIITTSSWYYPNPRGG
ncbi:hypothetical protein RUND412_008478 [Rhizina undulata]